ncbi:MAG: T9SS type A sorting domain-containing protein, partial [Flavobacteriia bacterium]|nr:T9SS type A sorting domain-containing protein [Flavobacteriia bacterium]
NLSPNQTVLVGIDGNAGAYCNFSISGTNITPLPVTFIDFSGFRQKYGVEMKWQTLSEKNNAFYSIESSRDLQNWNEIHREYVAGDTFGLKEYQFVDYNAPALDLIYYRLIQTDLNGTATILKVISFEETTYNNRMKVIPNPVNDEPTSVSIEWDYDTFGVFVVKDSQGKELLSKKASLMRGVNMVKLDMEALKSGLYMVEFSDNENKQMTKFIKL